MQSNIEQVAVQTYFENLAYFKEHHPDLFEKITALEHAIEQGHFVPRYELEYKEEGYFDVFEPSTGQWLYGSDSRKHAEIAAKSIDYRKEGNLFETFYNVQINEGDLEIYEKMNPIQSSLATTAEIIHYVNKYADRETTTMKKIYKFVFLGVGLGLHLIEIDRKIDSDVYMIIEDDLELFRLSMYVTNFKALANRNKVLIFSVFDEDETFRKKIEQFLKTRHIYNHYIKFFQLLSHAPDKLKTMQEVIAAQDYLVFNHAATLAQVLRTFEHIEKKRKILNISKKLFWEVAKDRPILLLGAGPSLKKHLRWLKEHADQFVIVAVSALLPLLEKEKIVPDIIMHGHGFEDAMKHIENVDSMSFFNDSFAIFNAFTPLVFAASFLDENLYLYQGISEVIQGFGTMTASNIGGLSALLLLKLGVPELYLLGLDFALDQKSGSTHVGDHSYSRSVDIGREKQLEDAVTSDNVITIPGNFEESVATTLLFKRFLDEFNIFVKTFKSNDQRIYNLSDGARIEHTEPFHVEMYQPRRRIDKEKLRKALKEILDRNAQVGLRYEDLKAVEARIEYINGIIDRLNEHTKKKHGAIEQYHYDLLGLFIDLLDEKVDQRSLDTYMIFQYYFKMIGGYVFDLLNTRELDNPKRHIKQFDRILMSQMMKLSEYYRDRLVIFLEGLGKAPNRR